MLETNVSFTEFNPDTSEVAPIIYGSARHEHTSAGVILGPKVTQGLRDFLKAYNAFVSAPDPVYHRIDAYFNEDGIEILEVNMAFIDGWGTALNLSRASNIQIRREPLKFPPYFATLEKVYLPELRLAVSELNRLGIEAEVCQLSELKADESAYVYGRFEGRGQTHYPRDGIRLDNKMNLARFSKEWTLPGEKEGWINGYEVMIPNHYIGSAEFTADVTPWEDIVSVEQGCFPHGTGPRNVVLKFCDKGGSECSKYRKSVVIGVPEGKNKYLRACYGHGKLIAQDYVRPQKDDEKAPAGMADNCQLIILAIGSEPITGYVQYSSKDIINDNSVHGPLALIG